MGLSTVINYIFRKSGLIILLLTCVRVAGAETAYVTDMLRLGVHEAADTSDRAFVNLESGDRLEILEQNQFYARVSIPDGRQGWVRKTFLVDEEPARFRIQKVEQERDRFSAELTALKNQMAKRDEIVGNLETQLASNVDRQQAERDELADLRKSNSQLTGDLEAYRFSVPGIWFLVAALVALVIGFFAGQRWLNRLSRQRHGGFVVR
jgi:SH3 domain protein